MSLTEEGDETSRPIVGAAVGGLLLVAGVVVYQAMTHVGMAAKFLAATAIAIVGAIVLIVGLLVGAFIVHRLCYAIGWLVIDAPDRFRSHLERWKSYD